MLTYFEFGLPFAPEMRNGPLQILADRSMNIKNITGRKNSDPAEDSNGLSQAQKGCMNIY